MGAFNEDKPTIMRALIYLIFTIVIFGSANAQQRPNFVLLLSDDQDWTGLSVQMHPDLPNSKSDFYRTPNLEKFAGEGMRFSAAYSPAPVCSPTRISLQTGMSPAKLGWTKAAPPESGHPLIEGANRRAIRADEVTIAEVLGRAGYATAHYGKWHLAGGGPEAHGYLESDGDTSNGDADPFVDPNPVDIFGMGERAATFMEKQQAAGRPFFIQMSYHALHRPENALKSTREFYDNQPPGAMHRDPARAAITTDLDTGVGSLLQRIDELGLRDNTYVVYMSDNGAGGGKGGGIRPITAGKGGVWEGGIRVPFIVRGPGIQPNSWCHERIVGYDLFPTFCHLARLDEQLPPGLEGGDISHLWTGSSAPVKRAREELVFHFPHYQGDRPHSAIIDGHFKAMHFYETGETMLFDLSKDLGETTDLTAQRPEKAKELAGKLAVYLKEVGAEMPKPNPDYDPTNEPPMKKGKEERKGGVKGKGKGKRRDASAGGPPVEPAGVTARSEAPRTPWILVHALELDRNQDGVIEYEAELIDEIARVFAGYDRDANGRVDREEAEAKSGMPRSALGGFVKEHAAELDRNQDGGISREEMIETFGRFFERQDGNADKRLTPDEYKVEGAVVARFPERMQPNAADPSGPLNVVLFLIDDLGWNGMGFSGSSFIETPRTDSMAERGMVFTEAYASAPNCAPTRACLMSGQYVPRHGVYTVVDDRHAPGSAHHKVLAAESRAELATETVTVAEALKQGGYATAMFGMWNLGRGSQGPTTPLGQGFDVFQQPRDLGFEKDRYFNEEGDYLTDAFTTQGIEWMRENRDGPFFLYLAYHGVHSPFEPKPDLLAKYEAKARLAHGGNHDPAYAATVEVVDQNVGRVVDALDELNLSEKTLVIFHSDNGGTRQYVRPLQGGKGTLYEGGLRVPTAIWGAGVQQGRSDVPMLSMDLYPTILDYAGLAVPEGHLLDGESLRAILQGKGELKRKALFWHFPSYIGGGGPSSAMREGDFKLIEFFESQSLELYNLVEDPGGTMNLAKSMPDKAQAMYAHLRGWQEEIGAPRPTERNPNYDPGAVAKKGRDMRGKGAGKGKGK